MGTSKKTGLDEQHPALQFFKYACCGGVAFAADMITFFLVARFLFPALTEDDLLVRLLDLDVQPVEQGVRTLNFVIGNTLAFMVSNLTAYLLNIRFVFRAGRHNRWKEVGLFYLVSGISIGIGVAIGVVLIEGFGLSTTYSYVAKSISATLINYVARKFIIFHG